jgi:hypothetical protein
MSMLRKFAYSETGAVTVDWVVLTASIVGLGIASVAAVRQGTLALGTQVQSSLSNARVSSLLLSNGLLVMTQNEYSDYVIELVTGDFANVENMYLHFVDPQFGLMYEINAGDQWEAAWRMDQMAAIIETYDTLGRPLPQSNLSFDDIRLAYHQAYP